MTVTTSLVVQFGDGDGTELLKAEIDTRDPAEGGFNDGDANFLPGDAVHYLVYRGAGVVLTRHEATLGVISSLGKRTRQIPEEDISFADAREATLAYPIKSLDSVEWDGPSPGSLQVRGDDRVVLPARSLAIGRVTYTTEFEVFRLANLPGTVNGQDEYSVLILLIGSAA